MNQEERVEQHLEVEQYLQNKQVYQIFQGLVEEILVSQPTDPISHMIDSLSKSDCAFSLLIGPPGLHLYKIAQQALNTSGNNYSAFNSGQFVGSLQSSLSQEAQNLFKNSRLIPDGLIGEKILSKVTQFIDQNPHSIIEGFPKTLSQAISLHHKGCIPDKIIFVNVNNETLLQLCKQKILQSTSSLSSEELYERSRLAANEYEMNNRDLKAFYPTYLEIDATKENSISDQIKKCLHLHFGQRDPRKNTKIVVIGSPSSGRTTLGKKIAAKYSLIYVSTAVLISEEIRRGTVIGRKINEKYLNHQMIDDFTVEKLIEERISKLDCEMQGYVLEGYPKNQQQLQNMKNMHINPNFIIGINPSENFLRERLGIKFQETSFKKRLQKWKQFSVLIPSDMNIFWVDPTLSIENVFQSVCFEIENYKK